MLKLKALNAIVTKHYSVEKYSVRTYAQEATDSEDCGCASRSVRFDQFKLNILCCVRKAVQCTLCIPYITCSTYINIFNLWQELQKPLMNELT